MLLGTIILAKLPLSSFSRPIDLVTAAVYGYLVLLQGILFTFTSWPDWVNWKCDPFHCFHSI